MSCPQPPKQREIDLASSQRDVYCLDEHPVSETKTLPRARPLQRLLALDETVVIGR